MILNSTFLSLQAVLAGAVSANQPECHVNFITWDASGEPSKPGTQRAALNSTTDVTILSAPNTAGYVMEPISVSIYNKDTASITVTVKTDDGTTERIIAKSTLLTLETLCYEKGQGWYALDANGNRKEATSSVFSSLTVTGAASIGGNLSVTGTGAFTTTTSTGLTLTRTGSTGAFMGIVDSSGAYTYCGNTNGLFSIQTSGGSYSNKLTISTAGDVSIPSGNLSVTGTIDATSTIKAGGYTVATLPANGAGKMAYVTDQLTAAAAKGVAPTGGGAIVCYVMNTGAGWVGI